MGSFNKIKYLLLLLLLLPSCIFSPDTGGKTTVVDGELLDPTSPRNVINNLQVAFSKKNINFYEDCLNSDYTYVSPSTTDSLNISWSRSEDVRVVGNVLSASREIIFTPSELSVVLEYGKNVPNIPDDVSPVNEHPNEIWYICNYYITMDIVTYDFGSFRVQQDMKFKMVKDSVTQHYSIIEWYDESSNITEKRVMTL